MKISELITKLQAAIPKAGDAEVYMDVEYTELKVSEVEVCPETEDLYGAVIIRY